MIHGRCVDISELQIQLLNQDGIHLVDLVATSPLCNIGDIVVVNDGWLKVLTVTRSKNQKFAARVLNPERRHALKIRSQVENATRDFFFKRNFLEVRTPLLVRSPGMETHIRPYRMETGEFLPTSPEFAMKKLLVGGLERIFQICPAFRSEPKSHHHHPEFTMLEWYRAFSNYEAIMDDFESLVEHLAIQINGEPSILFQNQKINVAKPWPRLTVRELFKKLTAIDLAEKNTVDALATEVTRLKLSVDATDTWDDLYFKIWTHFIEPQLPKDRAVFVTRYPASQAALAVVDQDADGTKWARRFEPYAGGLELGNAFEELTDPEEQRNRFITDMNLRAEIYGNSFPRSPIDEEFILALEEGLPPSGGIAVGLDRLVMLLADQPKIDMTLWLPSFVSAQPPNP